MCHYSVLLGYRIHASIVTCRYIGRVPSFDVEVNDYDVNTIFGEAILEAKCNGDDK